jgi:hypothetical protein
LKIRAPGFAGAKKRSPFPKAALLLRELILFARHGPVGGQQK